MVRSRRWFGEGCISASSSSGLLCLLLREEVFRRFITNALGDEFLRTKFHGPLFVFGPILGRDRITYEFLLPLEDIVFSNVRKLARRLSGAWSGPSDYEKIGD